MLLVEHNMMGSWRGNTDEVGLSEGAPPMKEMAMETEPSLVHAPK